jgi:hypothetical protein
MQQAQPAPVVPTSFPATASVPWHVCPGGAGQPGGSVTYVQWVRHSLPDCNPIPTPVQLTDT